MEFELALVCFGDWEWIKIVREFAERVWKRMGSTSDIEATLGWADQSGGSRRKVRWVEQRRRGRNGKRAADNAEAGGTNGSCGQNREPVALRRDRGWTCARQRGVARCPRGRGSAAEIRGVARFDRRDAWGRNGTRDERGGGGERARGVGPGKAGGGGGRRGGGGVRGCGREARRAESRREASTEAEGRDEAKGGRAQAAKTGLDVSTEPFGRCKETRGCGHPETRAGALPQESGLRRRCREKGPM